MPTPKPTPISGKQVNFLLALFLEAGLRSTQQQLEWIEFELDMEVKSLEEINTGQIQPIINRLKSKFNLD